MPRVKFRFCVGALKAKSWSSQTQQIRFCVELLKSSPKFTTEQTMDATFAQSVSQLVAQRDLAFLTRIADDYKLSLDELRSKYIETAAGVKVPRKYKPRQPKAVVVVEGEAPKPAKGEKQCCQGTTAKKEPCKFGALKGEVFCKRHLKKAVDEAPAKPVVDVATVVPEEVGLTTTVAERLAAMLEEAEYEDPNDEFDV